MVCGCRDSARRFSGSSAALDQGVPVFYLEDFAARLELPLSDAPSKKAAVVIDLTGSDAGRGSKKRRVSGYFRRVPGNGPLRPPPPPPPPQPPRPRPPPPPPHVPDVEQFRSAYKAWLPGLSPTGVQQFLETAAFIVPRATPKNVAVPGSVIKAVAVFGVNCPRCERVGSLQAWLKHEGAPRVGCSKYPCMVKGRVLDAVDIESYARAFDDEFKADVIDIDP